MNKFIRLQEAYFGNNVPNRSFLNKLTSIKILYYNHTHYGKVAFKDMKKQFLSIPRNTEGEASFGLVTKGISQKSFKAILFRRNELELNSYEDYFNQGIKIIYCDIFRVFNDYLIDMYDFLSEKIDSIPEKSKLSRWGDLVEAYKNQHFSIIPPNGNNERTADWFKIELNKLQNCRHVIVHNNGIIDIDFLNRCQSTSYKVGDLLEISTEEIGDAINFVETLVESIDTRINERFFSD